MYPKIWLSPPHMGGGEINYIQQAFNSNWIAPIGDNIDDFESDLASFLDTKKEVVCLSSGTAAIHLALLLAGVKPGDEVICQSLTFVASAFPINYIGAKPLFVDSEPQTWGMCPEYLEFAIKERINKGKKPKAIIYVHVLGMPAKVYQIKAIASKYGINLIEDAAEALGSEYKGEKCGVFGDFSIFSFNGNKIITTSGGGALVCNNLQDKKKVIFLATQAKEINQEYHHECIGYNYRMSNVLAGIGRGQMEVIEDRINKRRENNLFYKEMFVNTDLINLFTDDFNENIKSNHWLNCITISKKAKFNNKDIFNALKEKNIESRSLWKPIHMQPVYKNSKFYGETVSTNLFETALCLPSGSNLTNKDKERIASVLNKFIQ